MPVINWTKMKALYGVGGLLLGLGLGWLFQRLFLGLVLGVCLGLSFVAAKKDL